MWVALLQTASRPVPDLLVSLVLIVLIMATILALGRLFDWLMSY
jgi:hypothetical protein